MKLQRTPPPYAPAKSNVVWIAALTLAVLLIHGYHPGAEDGGIYAAGVYLRLHPTLFPHDADFVRAPMAYSMFASLLAGCSYVSRLDPPWILALAQLVTTGLTLFAVQRIARLCGYTRAQQVCSIALLAAWWTLPVGGTSLTIGDPYLTARSFSMPLSLLAISFSLESWRDASGGLKWRPLVLCAVCLLLASAMHRLMFGFALVLIVFVKTAGSAKWKKRLVIVALACVSVALVLSLVTKPESPAFVAAELTRQYWFLSEWQWYEVAGLAAPLLLFAARLRRPPSDASRVLLTASLAAGLTATLVAICFAREDASRHIVARLQPLRMFMLLYVVMSMELAALLVSGSRRLSDRFDGVRRGFAKLALPVAATSLIAVCMYVVQVQSFSSSRHIEWPRVPAEEPNAWVQAFQWCRTATPPDALFAINPTYIHLRGDDAQTFRAHALRSVLPDQSKDGGEAAVDPQLADRWSRGFAAQTDLNGLSDVERIARLSPLSVSWLLLSADAQTEFACPFINGLVKVCRLPLGR